MNKELDVCLDALQDVIINEQSLCEILGIEVKALSVLRTEKDFPCVHLNRRRRVYLADDVLEWLTKRARA